MHFLVLGRENPALFFARVTKYSLTFRFLHIYYQRKYYKINEKIYIFACIVKLPKIINAGVYRYAQKARQMVENPWIALSLRGLIRRSEYDPVGRLISTFDAVKDQQVPCLSVSVPGFVLDFEYGGDRENYVTILDWDGLRYDCDRAEFFLNYDGMELAIPGAVELSPHEAAFLRGRFEEVMAKYNSAIPRDQLVAEIMTQELFLRFLRKPMERDDAVEIFRKLLDEDEHYEKSILRHCRDLGENRDILRQRFIDRYKMTPREYRIRKRLVRILHLFTYSDLSLKEIAADVGMKNVTHLNALIRKYYGKTPKQLRQEYRSVRRLPS